MNLLTVTGNIGKDAEVRQAGSSTLCEFSLAFKSGYGDKAKTVWIKCTLWGKRAEGQLPQYLVKGSQVAISGEFSMDEWEKDGAKHSMPVVNVQSLDLIGGKQEPRAPQAQQPQHSSAKSPPQGAYPQKQPAGFDDFNDDIPF